MSHTICVIVPLILLVAPLAAENPPAQITVMGMASVQVEPDRMTWRLEVRCAGVQLASEAKRHDQALESLLKHLKKAGIKKDDIRIGDLAFGEEWNEINGERVKRGYYAGTTLAFTVSDLSSYRELYLDLVSLPDVNLKEVSFDTSRRAELRDEMRKQALLDARAKAEAMAATLGVNIGMPLTIEDETDIQDSFQYSEARREREAVPKLRQVTINGNVKVAFYLMPKGPLLR